jgi:hypothetical protein
MYEIKRKNKRKVIVFSNPVTSDKWEALKSLEGDEKTRVQIPTKEKWELEWWMHRGILAENPSCFREYVAKAWEFFFDELAEDPQTVYRYQRPVLTEEAENLLSEAKAIRDKYDVRTSIFGDLKYHPRFIPEFGSEARIAISCEDKKRFKEIQQELIKLISEKLTFDPF